MNNLRWWVGPQSDLMSAPTHCWGQSDWCVPSLPSPRGRIHCGVVWPVWATCTLPGLWCWGSGILAWVDQQGAQGREGQAQLTFPSEIRLGEGPCSTRRESDPLEGWIRRRTALGVCVVQASSLTGILAGGWAREMALVSAFVPRQAELCRQGLNNSPSRCPPALRFSEQSC